MLYKIIKSFIIILILLSNTSVIAQDAEKTVTLVVSGQGKTQDEAKQVALRSAIEQAFGAFISSKTEILKDNLVKDEIVSVTNGNIQNFNVISDVILPNKLYSITLRAVVSVTKLTSYVESKGVVSEFKGGLFASNILMQELNEKNEIAAIDNMVSVLKDISSNSFNYNIEVSEPTSTGNDNWSIPISINVNYKEYFLNVPKIIFNTLDNISLNNADLNNYIKLNKNVYPITISFENKAQIFYLRNQKSLELIMKYILDLNEQITNFRVKNEIKNYTFNSINSSIGKVAFNDDCFKILLLPTYENPKSIFDIYNDKNYYDYYNNKYRSSSELANTITSGGYEWINYVQPHVLQNLTLNINSKYDRNYYYRYNKHLPNKFRFLKSLSSGTYQTGNSFEMANKNNTIFKFKTGLGIIISFEDISTTEVFLKMNYVENYKLDQLKKISKFEILKN
jgi:hypothetical protein